MEQIKKLLEQYTPKQLKEVIDIEYQKMTDTGFRKFANAHDMIEFLREKYDCAFDTVVNRLVDGEYDEYIGSSEEMVNEGYVTPSDEIYTVIRFKDQDFYVEFTGYRSSYSEEEYTDFKQVTPNTKTVTFYE